ncbi:phosphoribosylanthranilate isomerase [Pseudomonas sp. C27(2019)]|uniref:phosphoribosylanthranilate isomerase n=1 Tax=Pseudomonas sp. C27(2019) TaxID=2604941 RepID=UPI00124406CC|nr:phosphoribosylanthranilate isomerase [Pseudomonas sp. C27(2019)]QEY58847.1 phosphoribosylanthranilate isomerase [Pseudomonas sp. C27(2019)]
MRVRTKICGITRVEDAVVAAQAGADAIGLVFYAKSPRAVSVAQAQKIVAALPPFVTVVGLFVNAARSEVNAVLDSVPLDVLQFHGDETPAECEAFSRPYFRALRMQPGLDIAALSAQYSGAQGVLLDAWVPGVHGGTGERFDWARIPENLAKPLILAGGLNADNVGQAVRQVQPWAVDVSGGVEVSPGIKDAEKIRKFLYAVHMNNTQLCDGSL